MKVRLIVLLLAICVRAFSEEPSTFQVVELTDKLKSFELAVKKHADLLEGVRSESGDKIEAYMLQWESPDVDAFGYCFGKARFMIVRFKRTDKILMCASRNLSQESLISLILAVGPNTQLNKVSGIISEDGLVSVYKAGEVLKSALEPE